MSSVHDELYITTKADSTTNSKVLTIIDSLKYELIHIHIEDALLRVEKNKLLNEIDTLQKKVISLQLTAMELLVVEKKLHKLKINYLVLSNKNTHLLEALSNSRDSTKAINGQLQIEKEYGKKIAFERNKLQSKIDNATKLSIAGVTIKANGIKTKKIYSLKNLSVHDTLIYFETLKADKVKQVIVSFILPQNKLFTAQQFNITVLIHGTAGIPEAKGITESILVTYNGSVQEISIPFNKSIDWRASQHLVEIFNDKELMYSGTLTLK